MSSVLPPRVAAGCAAGVAPIVATARAASSDPGRFIVLLRRKAASRPWMTLPRRPAAVDEQRAAGDERRRVGGEEHGRSGQLLQFAPAPQRDELDELLVLHRIVEQLPDHLGRQGTGPTTIHRD